MNPIPLPYRPPYDWGRMLDFWRRRALRGVETVTDEYRRSVKRGGDNGWITLRPDPDHDCALLTVSDSLQKHQAELTARVRHQFDLDADTVAIESALRAADPELAILPGLRLPRAFDPFDQDAVPYVYFCAGLALLTDSPVEDKVMVAFVLCDSEGVGQITVTEFQNMVLASLKVALACSQLATAKLEQSGTRATLEDLARLTVAEGLAVLNLSPEDPLSLELVSEIALKCVSLSASDT